MLFQWLDPQYSTLLFLTSNNLGSFTLFWKIGETRLIYTVHHNEEHFEISDFLSQVFSDYSELAF